MTFSKSQQTRGKKEKKITIWQFLHKVFKKHGKVKTIIEEMGDAKEKFFAKHGIEKIEITYKDKYEKM